MLRPSAIIAWMAGDALGGRGDLHEQVGLVDPRVQFAGGGDRGRGVVGQLGGDLDGHEAVGAAAGVEHRPQRRRGRR